MPGPPPKPADQRARRNKDPIPLRVIEVHPTPQPDLPSGLEFEWNSYTLAWWRTWGESELSRDFTDIDWMYLAETAVMVHMYWEGQTAVAPELRLRAAKFGATPEDRARLRIQVVAANEAEDKGSARGSIPSSRERYSKPQAM